MRKRLKTKMEEEQTTGGSKMLRGWCRRERGEKMKGGWRKNFGKTDKKKGGKKLEEEEKVSGWKLQRGDGSTGG